jgi:hypothetical protein
MRKRYFEERRELRESEPPDFRADRGVEIRRC